ncbi:hypothetical protein ITJ66_02935 [Plantibacter sp. VKM Ac-2885]|uniref:hypothetical protein n=1 Tax=Plantibacter sp. VKM Ac-2885 TaxID=2783828 RepID=UPI00188C66BB|nr:hypothetical protein [Plantibacter sp. VKM Ac-2885]MBF4511430.1 hypothetical protein [Plantibacter sp. VKM Ac-2885]
MSRTKPVKESSRFQPDGVEEEIRYGRDHERLRFFVSSRMNGTLDNERRIAADTIDRLVTHRAWWWERDALSGVAHSENECVKYAATSDGLVLLVAGELSGIVHAEYAAAKQAAVERYILIRDGDVIPSEVQAFIDQERKTTVTRNFQNAAELESHLYQALIRTTVRAAREVQIRRRQQEVSE